MRRGLGIGLLWVLLLALASVPFWLTFPHPNAQVVTQATQISPQGNRTVTLPVTGHTLGVQEHYRLAFQLQQITPQHLFIPVLSQRAIIRLNGQQIDDTHDRLTMVGMGSGMPVLLRLPLSDLRQGANTLDLLISSEDLVPSGLSPVYVGAIDQLAGPYRLRVFLLEYLRFMVMAAQILVTLVVGVLWLYRPAEELFGWLFLLLLMSMAIYLGMVRELVPHFMTIMPYVILAGISASLALLIVVLLIAGRSPPRWLRWATLVLPAGCIAVGLSGAVDAQQLVLMVAAPVNILSMLLAAVVVSWAALKHHSSEAWLLMLPVTLMTITGMHDLAVLLHQIDTPILLSLYYRPLMLIGIAMILMRRLGISLTRLDNVNIYLTQQLEHREAQLACLHEEERRKAAQQALSEERARLTADLHDGLSGHLASIIALSEREDSRQVEKAAREALDDLRLVVQSLDIDDRELSLALAGLRERLSRQLKRAGVQLEWSMARLPEIAGVTPSHALNVLRILQEAITNAIKHGEATCITVQGDAHQERARIIVENDGLPFPHHPDRSGTGLHNMRRRIRQLHGDIYIEPLDTGTRLMLLLPLRLPTRDKEQSTYLLTSGQPESASDG